MFECKVCLEKDKRIIYLENLVKDLNNRLLAFSKEAFTYYKSQEKNPEPLYPTAISEDGKIIDYKDMDLEKANEDIFRAFGENPITVEEKEN